MSYSGFGSYYTVAPGQVYPVSGMGDLGCCGSVGVGAAAVAPPFSASEVWQNIQKSDACYGPGGLCVGELISSDQCKAVQGSCNLAGQRALKSIAAALNYLGYGPVPVDGSLKTIDAYKKFSSARGLTLGPGFGISQQGLATIESDLQGGPSGPSTPSCYKKDGDQYIPVDCATGEKKTAGLGMLAVAGVVGVAAVAALVLSKKKKTPQAA